MIKYDITDREIEQPFAKEKRQHLLLFLIVGLEKFAKKPALMLNNAIAGFQNEQGIILKIAYARKKNKANLALWVYGKLNNDQKKTVLRNTHISVTGNYY